jgi:hypothetical protein
MRDGFFKCSLREIGFLQSEASSAIDLKICEEIIRRFSLLLLRAKIRCSDGQTREDAYARRVRVEAKAQACIKNYFDM